MKIIDEMFGRKGFEKTYGHPPRKTLYAYIDSFFQAIYHIAFLLAAAMVVVFLMQAEFLTLYLMVLSVSVAVGVRLVRNAFARWAAVPADESERVVEEKFNWLTAECPFESRVFRFVWRIYALLRRPIYFIWTRMRLWEVQGVHTELSKSERIDIFPARGGGRGFIIVLDNKKALYFYQDGDHFIYDGCEMGSYEDGDVTIFDHIEK